MANKKISYEKAYEKLEDIILQMEGGELNVDSLSANVKRAAELIKICKAKLFETEEEIEKILDNIDKEEL